MKRYTIEHCALIECENGGFVKYVDLKAKIKERLDYFKYNYPPDYFKIAKRELKEILNNGE